MPPTYAFSSRTAAWLLGLDVPPCDPIEVTVDRSVGIRARARVKLRRARLFESEVIAMHELRITCPLRTVRDLGSGPDIVEAVIAIEMALRAGIVTLADVANFVDSHPGEKGIARLRQAVSVVEPRSESPMETRLRMQLITARLPNPCVQAEIRDSHGQFLGRADLYYPDRLLIIEYDGANHRDRLTADMRRQNALLSAGYHLLRFTAADLNLPGFVAAQVHHARMRLR